MHRLTYEFRADYRIDPIQAGTVIRVTTIVDF